MEGTGKVANNAFNQAVGKVRQFAQRVGNFTESQKDYGNKVQGKIDNLARLVARLRDCKEQIRGIRQALRDCESRSSSALTEARAGADRARGEAVQAARDEERGRATDALNTAAANFDALSGALDGILASMNSIDNIDLGALEAEVNEICAEAGGSNEGKGNNNSNSNSNSNNNSNSNGGGKNQRFRSAARAVQGAEAFDRSRSGPAPARNVRAPQGAWGRGTPSRHGTAARARGANTRSSRGTFGGYRYNSKTRRNAGKSGKKKKKGTRRKRRRKRR
jgi:hypothetical protein